MPDKLELNLPAKPKTPVDVLLPRGTVIKWGGYTTMVVQVEPSKALLIIIEGGLKGSVVAWDKLLYKTQAPVGVSSEALRALIGAFEVVK